MFSLIKKFFIGLLTGLINASNHTKCVSLSSQKYMTQFTLINLNPHEYSQELHYYPFVVNLDRCVESCNTLNELSNKVCVPNKTEDLNLSAFNMITRIYESKTLIKYISCECKCKFDGRKWNNDKCRRKCRKHICEKYYIWNPTTGCWENNKHLASIIDNSVITCDEIIDVEANSNDKEAKNIPKNVLCETKCFYILLAFLLITIVLLIAFSIYFCLIKYKAKQKHLLPYYVTNDKLINVL